MSNDEDSVLTLSDIRNCMRTYRHSLVYQQDSLFYQATSQPKWMSAILSHAIIGCMTQNSGDFENSEASNFIRKNIGARSHNIDAKLRYLYEELIKDDYKAIAEEEAHLHIALSRCAFISALNDSQVWGYSKQGLIICDRYKDYLSGITSLSPEGEQLSNNIRSSLISSIGLKIGRQCLPYDYTSDDIKESNLPEVLGSIDGVRLLTAAIIIALNYQNNSSERRTDDKEVDALTKRIHQFLLSGKKIKYESLTIEKIFKSVAPKSVITICKLEHYDLETWKPIKSLLVHDVLSAEALEFMGLDAELLDLNLIDAQELFRKNSCESTDALKYILKKYCPKMETIWTRIAKNIKNNFLHSLRASSYYEDSGVVTHELDEEDYPISVNENRLRIILNKTYPTITGIIKKCGFDDIFFEDCSLELSYDESDHIIERVIDSIVALILISICYCKSLHVDEELDLLKKRYIRKLCTCIHNKFALIPPSDGGSDISDFKATLEFLMKLKEKLLEDEQYRRAEDIDKFFEQHNIGYHDENSFLPPSRGRDH